MGLVPFSSAFSAEKSLPQQIAEATDRIATELEKGPRLELPPLSPEEAAVEAPELIRKAGEEFVAAWRLSRRVHLASVAANQQDAKENQQQAAGNPDSDLKQLIQRTIEGTPPPALSEYASAFERNRGPANPDCGQDDANMMEFFNSLMALRNLRAGEHLKALPYLHGGEANAKILHAYGIDREELAIGSWLYRGTDPAHLEKIGTERVARMLLKWAEMRWAEAGKDAAKDGLAGPNRPLFPTYVLVHLLKPANEVTDETKARVSNFLATAGVQLRPVDFWLQAVPPGTEKWMAPLAKLGLEHELNEVREKSSDILANAGIPHDPPALKQPARFRVTVNGAPWPGGLAQDLSYLSVSLLLQNGSKRDHSAYRTAQGIFALDPDDLANVSIKEAAIEVPRRYDLVTSPGEPLLRVPLPNPIPLGEVQDIDFKTVGISIRPKLPTGRGTPARLIEIEFGPVSGESTPRGCRYHLKEADELILPHVSHGEYWLRVRHPGTALMPWTKVKVGPDTKLLAPRLEVGSTLVVPLTPSKLEIPESWPPQLRENRSIRLGYWEEIIELWRDGTRVVDLGPTPEGADDHFPHSAIFASLAPGEYEVRTRRFPFSTPTSFQLIEPRTIKVSVRPDGPVYQLTEPLELKLNPLPKEKEGD